MDNRWFGVGSLFTYNLPIVFFVAGDGGGIFDFKNRARGCLRCLLDDMGAWILRQRGSVLLCKLIKIKLRAALCKACFSTLVGSEHIRSMFLQMGVFGIWQVNLIDLVQVISKQPLLSFYYYVIIVIVFKCF